MAQEEGFSQIANHFKLVASVEQMHEQRYMRLLERMENDQVFKQEEPTVWMCRKCGFTVNAKAAPKRCPVCGADQGWFERKANNY